MTKLNINNQKQTQIDLTTISKIYWSFEKCQIKIYSSLPAGKNEPAAHNSAIKCI